MQPPRSAPNRIRDTIRFGFEWPSDWSFEVLAYLRGVGPVPARRPSIDLPKERCDVHRQAAPRSPFCTLWAFHFIMKPARGGEAVGAQKDALNRVSACCLLTQTASFVVDEAFVPRNQALTK